MSSDNVITDQPQRRSNTVLTQSRFLTEVPAELHRIVDLPAIVFRPSRQFGCSPKEFEVLEDREFRRIFRGVSLNGCCSCADPAIAIINNGNTQEILQLHVDPHTCCFPTFTGTISCPPGNIIGKAIHINGWFSETFEMMDIFGNTVFLVDSRRRWDNSVPEFEITTTNLVSIGRISLSIHSFFGTELTLRWLVEDVSPQIKVLGLGFLLFLQIRISGRYKERNMNRGARRRRTYDYALDYSM